MNPVLATFDDKLILDMLKRLSALDHLQNRFVLVFDDISACYPLIKGFFETKQGVFRDLSLSETMFSADIPEEQLAIVSDFSKELNITGTKDVGIAFYGFDPTDSGELGIKLMIEEDGRVSEGKPLESKSQDRASVLATILVSPIICSYEGYGTIGILYNLDLLDPTNIEKLNEYFCNTLKEHFPNIKPIIFVRTRTLEKVFFHSPVQLVGALTTNEFIHIMPADATNNRIRSWASRLRKDEPIIFFLGAGCSFEAGIPMGDALLRRSLEDLLNKSGDVTDQELEELFWNHVRINNHFLPDEEPGSQPLTFERVIREQIKQHDYSGAPTIQYLAQQCSEKSPSMGHICLGEILKKGYRIIVVTTNYDTLAEEIIGYYQSEGPLIIDDAQTARQHADLVSLYMQGKADGVPIIKLHGTIDRLETLAASVEDTRVLRGEMKDILTRILSKKGHVDAKLQERLRVVFSGYSFRDVDVWKVLEDEDIYTGMEDWIADPLPRHRAHEFLNLDTTEHRLDQTTRVFSTTFDLFMETLCDAL